MSKEEILSKAIYLQFPLQKSHGSKNVVPDTYKNYNIDTITKLPASNGMLYSSWGMNEHHYTTEYHWKYVLPTIAKLLSFNYNENDFTLPERKNGQYNITIPVPKKEYFFQVTNLGKNITENLDYNGLTHGKEGTEYHKLIKWPHQSLRIVNETTDSHEKLFISGDSQLIPSIAFISLFFKEVWYFDNRDMLHIYEKYKDVNFDKVLIQLYAQELEYYIGHPFL